MSKIKKEGETVKSSMTFNPRTPSINIHSVVIYNIDIIVDQCLLASYPTGVVSQLLSHKNSHGGLAKQDKKNRQDKVTATPIERRLASLPLPRGRSSCNHYNSALVIVSVLRIDWSITSNLMIQIVSSSQPTITKNVYRLH